MNGASLNPFSRWLERRTELHAVAGAILSSPAVQRLSGATFLGILSPRFRTAVESPLWPATKPTNVLDGSRYDHSLGVALVALDLARRLGLSDRGQRYAVAWGLTHDIATWPLSHTGEPALAAVTGSSARNLRTAILLGTDPVPERYRLAEALRESGIDPSTLVTLFERGTVTHDEELNLLKQVVRSPLTPDTLEGTWRCGLVFGTHVAPPHDILTSLVRAGEQARLDVRCLPSVMEFWRDKADVYHRFINRDDVIHWESAWAAALQRCYSDVSLADSLELNEDEMVERVKRSGVPPTSRVVRYKEPQDYIIHGGLDALPPQPSVSDLWRVLRREPVGSTHE